MTPACRAALLLAAGTLAAAATAAPRLAAQDTLRLGDLHEAALRRDPRSRQPGLLESETELRLESLAAERLPQLSLEGEASHQSDVATLGVPLGGAAPPHPPADRWQAELGARQLLYDGGSIAGRRGVERARLAESREEVRVAQHQLRGEVNSSFFSALLLQERAAELAALAADLDARLAVMRARVREGAALPGDTAALRAELLRAGQDRDEALASRRAALEVLGGLVGEGIAAADVLALPDLAGRFAEARRAAGGGPVRARPEFARFARARDRIAEEIALAGAERRPRAYAFAQAGYGTPGLRQFRDEPDAYWLAGVRVEWQVWDWGTSGRQREALRVARRIVETDEAAFAEAVDRAVRGDLADVARLEAAAETDAEIVALRERAERQARAQLDEGAITAADYVDARTDLLEARVARRRHRVELAQAQARYLTTLGLEPR